MSRSATREETSRLAEPVSVRILTALAVIVAVRLLLHVLLYASGFASLTADEFARVVAAARWAQHPYWETHGDWLPLHAALYGLGLELWWNLLWVPRCLTIVFGVVAVVAMALLTRTVLQSWRYGVVGAALLAINPGHLWLSSTPLTEAPYTAFTIAAAAAFVRHLRTGSGTSALLSGALLGLACGLRYEGWMLAIPYSVLLLARVVGRRERPAVRVAVLVSAVLPWTVPLYWLIGNWAATDDPLHFLHSIRQYKSTWYGDERAFGGYLRTFFRLDPFATVLVPVGLVAAFRGARRDAPLAGLAVLCVVSLAIFVALHRGQVESVNNSIRYLGPFLFLAYPFVLVAVDGLARRWGRVPVWAWAAGALAVAGWQMHGAFAYVPDANAAGLAVGQRIRELRAADGREPVRPAMIELTYWAYLAVHVGADDVDRILYDRQLDLAQRQSKSLIFWDLAAVQACLERYDVGYIAVRTPELRAILHRRLGLGSGQTVGDWEILALPPPENGEAPAAAAGSCPLPMPAG